MDNNIKKEDENNLDQNEIIKPKFMMMNEIPQQENSNYKNEDEKKIKEFIELDNSNNNSI